MEKNVYFVGSYYICMSQCTLQKREVPNNLAMPVMVVNICEIHENWGRQGRTVLTGVTEITHVFSVKPRGIL
jgi:hypothetical protein